MRPDRGRWPRPSRARSPHFQSRRSPPRADRKSTRLNSSHLVISYAVFCLKKKNFSVTGGRASKGTVCPAGTHRAALSMLAAALPADAACGLDDERVMPAVEPMLHSMVAPV